MLEVDGGSLNSLNGRGVLAKGDPVHLQDVAVLCDHLVCLRRIAHLGNHQWLKFHSVEAMTIGNL